MTTTNRPRFRRDSDPAYAHCMGTNHRDSAPTGHCSNCGVDVVKTEKGRILDLNHRYNRNDRPVVDYACWSPSHECDPETTRHFQARVAEALAQGDLIPGQHVTVIKGRKVAKGMTGTIVWTGMSDYGLRVGLKIEGDDNICYVAATNVQATNQLGTQPVDELTAQILPDAPARKGSHANCDHEATPAARARCRKLRQG